LRRRGLRRKALNKQRIEKKKKRSEQWRNGNQITTGKKRAKMKRSKPKIWDG
jgi:hypothetical protein